MVEVWKLDFETGGGRMKVVQRVVAVGRVRLVDGADTGKRTGRILRTCLTK